MPSTSASWKLAGQAPTTTKTPCPARVFQQPSAPMTLLALAAVVLVGIPTWHDGDSGRIGTVRVRIDAIDAPELPGSPKCRGGSRAWSCSPAALRHAEASRDRLRRLTIGGVECRAEEQDRYERTVVRCRLPDGRDPAAVLVREGLARPDLRYGGRRYAADETIARTMRRGAWR
jgi:endonuclease YncB( thermonuclease family)